MTRSLPESEGDGDQQKNGDHEARHPEKSGDRCAVASVADGSPNYWLITLLLGMVGYLPLDISSANVDR